METSQRARQRKLRASLILGRENSKWVDGYFTVNTRSLFIWPTRAFCASAFEEPQVKLFSQKIKGHLFLCRRFSKPLVWTRSRTPSLLTQWVTKSNVSASPSSSEFTTVGIAQYWYVALEQSAIRDNKDYLYGWVLGQMSNSLLVPLSSNYPNDMISKAVLCNRRFMCAENVWSIPSLRIIYHREHAKRSMCCFLWHFISCALAHCCLDYQQLVICDECNRCMP